MQFLAQNIGKRNVFVRRIVRSAFDSQRRQSPVAGNLVSSPQLLRANFFATKVSSEQNGGELKSVLAFLALAVVAILAAYKYTAGKGAYGYHALGDVFVFAFFGLLAVGGSYYLQTKQLDNSMWWFAIAIGGLSTGVLNLNNMRDMHNDSAVVLQLPKP